jgi:predicted phosphoribosyltransferase
MSIDPQMANSLLPFADRHAAGEQLAAAVLQELVNHPVPESTPCVVYALPRGGLPIAAPVANALSCPLDVVVAKKITRPENRELAIGAVTADGYVVWSPALRSQTTTDFLLEQNAAALDQARAYAQAQFNELASASPRFQAQGTIALLVDDGIATGMTIAAAVQALRAQQPAQVWICVPVAPVDLLPTLQAWGDRVIILATPTPFYSVSRFYQQFPQVSTAAAAVYLQEQNHLK